MQKRMIAIFLAGALFISGLLSILSIHGLQGNSRIINYAGVVRGATQRLIKQELNGQPNDCLLYTSGDRKTALDVATIGL